MAGQSKWPTSGFWAVGAIAGCGVWTLVERNRGLVAEGKVLLNFPGAGQFSTQCLDIYYLVLSGKGMRMRTRTCRYKCGSNKGIPKLGFPWWGPRDPYTMGSRTGM